MAPDGWWLSVAWLADDEGVVPFRELAPAAGPPPDPPVARLGPALAGHLSGLIAEIDGRLGIRLAPLVPPADASRPWRSPAALRIALRLEPARAMTLRSNEIAELVQDALGRALEGLRRP